MAYSMNEHRAGPLKAKAIEIARALLDRKVGFLEGVRGMFGVASEFGDSERVEYFGPFIGVYSETDTFPTGDVRSRWSKEALERADRELAEAERLYRPAIESACRALIEKWS